MLSFLNIFRKIGHFLSEVEQKIDNFDPGYAVGVIFTVIGVFLLCLTLEVYPNYALVIEGWNQKLTNLSALFFCISMVNLFIGFGIVHLRLGSRWLE